MAYSFEDEPRRARGSRARQEGPRYVSALSAGTVSERAVAAASGHSRGNRALMVCALVLAVLFVGGTTLYITRPWDPNAYAIHSFVDADTSMEGYPGLRTHLSGQDSVVAAEQQAYVDGAQGELDAFEQQMATRAGEADEILGQLDAFLSGTDVDLAGLATTSHALRDAFAEEVRAMGELDLEGTELAPRKQTLEMLAGYLTSEISMVDAAVTDASHESDRSMAVAAARSALAGRAGDYSAQEWRDLYRNAVANLSAT